ncbi:hypothetical protein ACHAPA_004540 [Fusarium lateritium]
MDLMSLSAGDITRECLNAFERCLIFRPHQDIKTQSDKSAHRSQDAVEKPLDERFDYRLADFNLWIDGIGALAPSKASLDARLKERPIDLSLVTMNLIMLLQALDDCEISLANGLSLDETLLDIDSALESLVSLSLAIRRTGRKSRLHKADRLFDPQEHAELKKHLECIIVLRPNAKGRDTDGEFQHKIESLTPVQQHLITSNLRRRNRFIQAQLHSLGLKRRAHGFELPVHEPVEESIEPVMTSQHQPPRTFDPVATGSPTQPNQHLPPTMPGTSASDPESKLEYKEPAPKEKDPGPMTVITQITASARYPQPRLFGTQQQAIQCPCCCQTLPVQEAKNNNKWRKHLSEDIRPYTCIFNNCPTPDIYYSSRATLERHFRQDHRPIWQCPICSNSQTFTSMTDMLDHLHVFHKDSIGEDDLSANLYASAQAQMGIDSCPLCDVVGPLDSPELIDHVLEHIHDFSLRSLPWPRSTQPDLGGEVGSFDIDDEESATVVTQWLDGYEHETSDASPTLQLSKWDLDRLQIIAEQIASRQEDKLGLEICFADEHGDRSAAAETEVSKHSMEPFKTSHPEEPYEKGGEQLQEHEIPEKTSRWRFRGGADPLSIASTVVSIVSLTDRLNPIARKARKDLAKPPETSDTASILMALFEELKRADVALSIVKFRAFLENIQGETAPTSIPLVQDYYDLEAFTNIMLKSSMDAIRPLPPQDLSKPITDYFIDSSHNTYLTGYRLNSRASASPYRHALLDGCRFIEIDVWNGDPAAPTNMSEGNSTRTPEVVSTHQPSKTSSGMIQRATKRLSRAFNTGKTEASDKYDVPTQEPLSGPSSKVPFGEPIVTHGWTLTTPCGFRDVCTAIGESAFVTSDLPVIVSLEVHADLEQQEKMVEIMKQEWKGILLDSPLDGYDPAERLPRLEDLKNKILVKCSVSTTPTVPPKIENSSQTPEEKSQSDPDTNSSLRSSKVPISESLARLAVYTRSERFRGFHSSEASSPAHIFSLSETKFHDLVKTSFEELFTHNQQHLFRVFPGGPTDWANPNPLALWEVGVQMVSMNRMTLDTATWLSKLRQRLLD